MAIWTPAWLAGWVPVSNQGDARPYKSIDRYENNRGYGFTCTLGMQSIAKGPMEIIEINQGRGNSVEVEAGQGEAAVLVA